MIKHPHAGEDARRLAESGTVLLTQVGSAVLGTALDAAGDRDELGLCLEPADSFAGSARVRTPGGREVPFEQYELHSAWGRPRGTAERSGAGDLDLVVYSARKWTRLALSGNPSVLLPLWVPAAQVVRVTDAGRELRDNAHRFASRTAGRGFLGYLRSQRAALAGERGRRAAVRARRTRPGYDIKPAVHALRLGVQGLELLRTGSLTLPIPHPELDALRAVRRGDWELRDVEAWLDELQADLGSALSLSDLPETGDRTWVEDWLTRSHQAFWAS